MKLSEVMGQSPQQASGEAKPKLKLSQVIGQQNNQQPEKHELKSIFPTVGVEAGGSSPEDIAISTLQKTGQDVLATPAHFFNQMGFNYPRSIARKAGIEYPEDTQSAAAGIAAKTAGVAGAVLSPINKILGPAKGAKLLPRIGSAMAESAAYAPTEDPIGIGERVKQGMFGALTPLIGKALGKPIEALEKSPELLKNQSARVVNSLIKPLLKDFSYGKNPGMGVAREGIVAKDFDELAQKIGQKKKDIGLEIRQTLIGNSGERIDARQSLQSVDDAIKEASKSPKTNSSLIQRLNDLKSDILGYQYDPNGNVVSQRNLIDLTPEEALDLKQQVGDLTKWTGNKSDDEMVNKALKKTYGVIKQRINQAVPAVKDLNERYADLLSAEVATKYRDKIMERQNLVSLAPKLTGAGAVIGGLISGNVPVTVAGAVTPLVDKAVSSPRFKTGLASRAYKLGDNISKGNTIKNLAMARKISGKALRGTSRSIIEKNT